MAALGVAAVTLALTILMSVSAPRRSGTDLTPNGAFVTAIGGGEQACQEGELLPADTSSVLMTIGTYGAPGPPLTFTATAAAGGTLTHGTLPGGWHQGRVTIPVGHVSSTSSAVRVCLRDDDPASKPGGIALAGDAPDPGYTMQVGNRTIDARLRYEYLRPGRESWWQLLPTVVYRFGLAKANAVRHWAWVAVLLLMLGAIALALRTIVSESTAAQREDSG